METADNYSNKAIELSPTYFDVAIQNREQNLRRYSSTIYDTLNSGVEGTAPPAPRGRFFTPLSILAHAMTD